MGNTMRIARVQAILTSNHIDLPTEEDEQREMLAGLVDRMTPPAAVPQIAAPPSFYDVNDGTPLAQPFVEAVASHLGLQ